MPNLRTQLAPVLLGAFAIAPLVGLVWVITRPADQSWNTYAILMERGKSCFKSRDYNSAISVFTEASLLKPQLPQPYVERAAVYRFKGNPDKAIADCTEAIKLEPNDAEAFEVAPGPMKIRAISTRPSTSLPPRFRPMVKRPITTPAPGRMKKKENSKRPSLMPPRRFFFRQNLRTHTVSAASFTTRKAITILPSRI